MSMKYDKTDKYRYWIFILYPESMVDNWRDIIDDVLQVPCCYIIHDKDNFLLEEDEHERKVHIHLWVCWNNTVWYGAILKLLNKHLAKPVIDDDGNEKIGSCGSTAEPVFNPERAFLYLCHKDPKSLKKSYKYKYDDSERVFLNNFDIGSIIELGKDEIIKIKKDLTYTIRDYHIFNTLDLFFYIDENLDDFYMYVFQNFNQYFVNQCTACWKKYAKKDLQQ